MSEVTISSLIGNIKRNYSKEDFNPFKTMEFVYDHCLSMGSGSKVLIIGFSKRFQNDIIPATLHVMASRKILTKPPIPYPIAHEITSHTGCIIRFSNILDSQSEQAKITRELNEASIVVVCNKYKHPMIKQIIRFRNSSIKIYDLSKEANNNINNG